MTGRRPARRVVGVVAVAVWASIVLAILAFVIWYGYSPLNVFSDTIR